MTRKCAPPSSLTRSSFVDSLIFVASGSLGAVFADDNVWLSQEMMTQIYGTELPIINCNLQRVDADTELHTKRVVRTRRIAAADGIQEPLATDFQKTDPEVGCRGLLASGSAE